MKKKIFSRLMAMVMALSLLSTSAFAASFTELQDAIDNGVSYYKDGFSAENLGETDEETYRIKTSNITNENGESVRDIKLFEDVEFDKETDELAQVMSEYGRRRDSGIVIDGSKESAPDKVVIDLNGSRIDLNPELAIDTDPSLTHDEKQIYYAQKDENGDKIPDKDRGAISTIKKMWDAPYSDTVNVGTVITIRNNADVTINDSSAKEITRTLPGTIEWNGSTPSVHNTGEHEVTYYEGGTGSITGGYTGGWYLGGGITVTNGSTLTTNGVNVEGNINEYGQGGGIHVREGSTLSINGGSIKNNWAGGHGGGINVGEGVSARFTGVEFYRNKAAYSGGGMIVWNGARAVIDACTFVNNGAEKEHGSAVESKTDSREIWVCNSAAHGNFSGVYGDGIATIELRESKNNVFNSTFCNNTYYKGTLYEALETQNVRHLDVTTEGSSWELTETTKAPTCIDAGEGEYTCKYCGETKNFSIPATGHKTTTDEAVAPTCTETGLTEGSHCSACGEVFVAQTEIPALEHEYGDWYVTREAQPGVPGEERHDCVRGDAFEARPIPALPMPVDFSGGLGGGDTGTTIADEETPLAGLFTRADAIGYLWEQNGSPEAELSTFADVPEDHYWAVAIGWAEDMGIAVADEEGNFRPDDLVLRSSDEPEGELQEFLNRYAVFAGVELDEGELFVELDGAADDVIMGEEAQVIFNDFFAKLEKALAEQEKAA